MFIFLQVFLYLVALFGLAFLGLFVLVSLVALGCSNTKAEALRAASFLTCFFLLFAVSAFSLLMAILGYYQFGFGISPIVVSAALSIVPIAILCWLRKLAIPCPVGLA